MRKKKESFFWSLNQTQTVKSSQIRMIISLTYNTYSKTIPVSQYNLKYFEPQLNVSKNNNDIYSQNTSGLTYQKFSCIERSKL